MISHKADVEARNAADSTPLISAATAGNVDALRMLIDNGEGEGTVKTPDIGAALFFLCRPLLCLFVCRQVVVWLPWCWRWVMAVGCAGVW